MNLRTNHVTIAAAVLVSTGLVSWAVPLPGANAVAPIAHSAVALAPQGKVTPPKSGHGKTVTVYLTRHGQTILNTLERVQGWTDSPLIVAGRALPVTVGKNIRAREGKFDAAYSADMKRHNETALLMLQGAGQSRLDVTQLEGLREVNFGKYEGSENKELWTALIEELGYQVDHNAAPTAPADANGQNGGWQTMQAIAAREKGLDALMSAMKTVASEPAENGAVLPAEDCTDVNTRMSSALNAIARSAVRHHDDSVLVVSSGLSISCYLTDSLGTVVSGGISNVAVSKLQYANGTWTVLTVNDKSYQQ
ncbi:MAG: histidine phosphatase family protein [Actinobacteria bacterium]|nr:histidine phosphatase family protein [Actinomycetota bacterium]